MPQGILGRPQHQAKTAGIAQPQADLAVKFQIDVVVWFGRGVGRGDAQGPRHSQMHDEGALGKFKKQVLGASRHLRETLATQDVGQILRHGLAKTALAHHHARDAASLEVGGDTPSGGFNFG